MTRISHDKKRKISVKTSAQVDLFVKARTSVNKSNLKVSTQKQSTIIEKYSIDGSV